MSFIELLKERHAKNYHGTDDDMPDAFDSWLVELDADEWIAYGEIAFLEGEKAGLKRGQEIALEVLKSN